MDLKKFVFYSTLVSIFTEAMRYHIGFDMKFFYLIILFNTVALLAFNNFVYNRGLLIFHSIIFITGTISCLIGYNHVGSFLSQFIFLLLIPTYYFSFYTYFQNRLEDIVKFYCRACLCLAVIGFLKLPLDLSEGESLHSIMLEPAHYCTIVLPAFFITLKDKSFPRYYFIIISISIILSGSSLGFIGLGLSMILFAKRISIVKTALTSVIVVGLGLGLYVVFPPFKLRFDDTINSAISSDLSKANLSTYAFLSNFYVSSQSFLSNPVMGNGIGSHVESRNLYLQDITGIEVFEKAEMDQLNAKDAASLFSRLMSEMGLIGIVGVFYFIIRFYVPNKDDESLSQKVIISRAILLYFFAKLFREGHYFSPEMYFFVFLYVFNKYDDMGRIKPDFANE